MTSGTTGGVAHEAAGRTVDGTAGGTSGGERPIVRISTHVLDTTAGRPAAGIPVTLQLVAEVVSEGLTVGSGVTDDDGRVASLTDGAVPSGVYRFVFDTAGYFAAVHRTSFYPRITLEVHLDGARDHYHVPVLASPYSFSTYLGS